MFNRYFQQELDNLKDLGAEFSKAHPAIAPMLSGRSTDPDVDRLLEGVAFLTALLRQKLDDEIPEVIHDLIQMIWPHYLRPLPSASIVTFSPKPILKQSLEIPAGIEVSANPVEGTACRFQTCYPVTLHPLHLLAADWVEVSGQPPAVRLSLQLKGLDLDDWQPDYLRLFLAGDMAQATDLFLLLRQHLRRIILKPVEGGEAKVLPPEDLRPVGFNASEAILPYPTQSFPAYRVIQEYFLLPEKFLFLDLVGWERWRERGSGDRFEVLFELENVPFSPPRVKTDDFKLFATPVVNIFPFDADPIRLDHRKSEYRVRPSTRQATHYQVYAIDAVTGFVQGTAEERTYHPFEMFGPDDSPVPVYHTHVRNSPIRSGFDVYLSVAYPPALGTPVLETLSLQLLCTNGFLPEELRTGDIVVPTSSSPEYATFTNIRPPTSNILPPLGTNLLWRLISHLSLNYVPLDSLDNLQALLRIYLFKDPRHPASFLAHQKRIAGIDAIQTDGADRLINGAMVRGRDIHIAMRHDHFASQGDLYLFGSILDYFLGAYASMNTYTRLTLKEVNTGGVYQWPARLGETLLS